MWAAASAAGSARSRSARAGRTGSAAPPRRAKPAKVDSDVGAQFGPRPPFAQRGRAPSVTSGCDAALVQTREQRVVSRPVHLPRARLDLAPVDRHPHDVDAEPVEPVEPVVERAGAVRSHASSWMP